MHTPAKIAMVILSAFVLTFVIYKSTAKYHVRYIVPKDFRGTIAIAERDRGVKPKKNFHLWTYEIPPSGTLLTTDASIFEEWHTEEASYTDGTMLPVYGPDKATEVMLFHLEANGQRTWYLFVGTEEEYQKALSFRRFEIPE